MKKPGVSSLNPYAEPYIPLAKRKDPTVEDVKPGNEAAWFEPCSRSSLMQILSVLNVYMENNRDLEATIDRLNQLEFLCSFLDISKHPDMKMFTFESSESLPDTLDISDVSESRSSTPFGARRLKNVAGDETGASSSGSMESDIAS
ncbi:putative pentatricopeptide repeat-containing protein [Hibiscus syriacus]|uniref:Pentatricopeptide repeat-containing protein n=1 Tax=Hibiscus syriacus TaxID=106335 RepID=A0A6A2YTN4_HIBSY|nr:putative pentatricopeptide repeat-containing protein [Hibiscus syriacus]